MLSWTKSTPFIMSLQTQAATPATCYSVTAISIALGLRMLLFKCPVSLQQQATVFQASLNFGFIRRLLRQIRILLIAVTKADLYGWPSSTSGET